MVGWGWGGSGGWGLEVAAESHLGRATCRGSNNLGSVWLFKKKQLNPADAFF